MRTIAILTLIGLCGCASQPQVAGPCPQPAKVVNQPVAAKGMFDRCLTEIEAYGRGEGPMSRDCSVFLRPELTTP
jgi:hypothetical protein